jgi:hypothetical protein
MSVYQLLHVNNMNVNTIKKRGDVCTNVIFRRVRLTMAVGRQ